MFNAAQSAVFKKLAGTSTGSELRQVFEGRLKAEHDSVPMIQEVELKSYQARVRLLTEIITLLTVK